jgi:hypothetical protein
MNGKWQRVGLSGDLLSTFTCQIKEDLMAETYTLTLISLECIQAHAPAGDFVRLMRDDATLWESSPYKMHPSPTDARQISDFDFAEARKGITPQAWQADTNFDADALIFVGQSGESHLKVCLAQDAESLADTVISAKDAGRGNILIVCSRENVLYHLVYRVDAEE